ncbi:glycosylphosphatidylinositol-alpha 1,4 mannosyltransferase I [Sporobolomyces salmoneus]|uniref:glycosylphosphatidylinositol-alpha 1,4 mannosyltransferase I n=1 Tax=Sporobolomyces salmoneus TaxID=183962 RepID=UPI00316EE6AD
MRFRVALLLGVLLRVVLLLWGSYQDVHGPVKYTDIDYFVFSDASTCLLDPTHSSSLCSPAKGRFAPTWLGDPYSRSTYRYTPLLAILLIPNRLFFPSFGKLLFATSDLVVAILLYRLMRRRGSTPTSASNTVALTWLLNPMIANISTRGSSESIIGLLVVGTLSFAERRQWDKAAMGYGVAVHFKIFPVIYGSSFLVATMFQPEFSLSRPLRFGLVSFATFMALNIPLYLLWGQPFLQETFLYHLSRLDHRHNFSPYFYPYYLSSFSSSTAFESASSFLHCLAAHPLAAFLPQMILALGLGFLFGAKDLPYAWLVQSFAFVAFNKVCTSQYFLWYLWLLPPALSRLSFTRSRAITTVSVWVLSQAIWLSQAYNLEIAGTGGYLAVWIAGLGFFVAQVWVLGELLAAFR